MSATPRLAGARLRRQQIWTLLGLRFTLARRAVQSKGKGAALLRWFVAICAVALSLGLAFGLYTAASELGSKIGSPEQQLVGVTILLCGPVAFRLYLGLVMGAAGSPTALSPRRLRNLVVSPRLTSQINAASQFVEPLWLMIYPPLLGAIVGLQRAWHNGPGVAALSLAALLAVLLGGSLSHLGAGLWLSLESRPRARRTATAFFLISVAFASQLPAAFHLTGKAMTRLLLGPVRLLPPFWPAHFALAVQRGRPGVALGLAGCTWLLCAAALWLTHRLAMRNTVAPPELVQASDRARSDGWSIPWLAPQTSALVEKDVRTLVRIGWMQMLMGGFSFAILMWVLRGKTQQDLGIGFPPMLWAAGYAQVGVLEFLGNGFGRDRGAARGFFLWPVELRHVLAAKVAVAYAFSLVLYGCLATALILIAHVPPGQLWLGLCGHLASFPLAAAFGLLSGILWPAPLREARTKAKGPSGLSRLALVLVISGVLYAPYRSAVLTGLPVTAGYLSLCALMLVVLVGSLGLLARVLESRRELLVRALSVDEGGE